MSVLFTDVMTVYNYYKDADGKDSWQRTVIRGIQWRHSKKELMVSKGVQSEELVESITINFACNYGRPVYIEPVKYRALPDAGRAAYWTLDDKQGLDIMVLGEITEEIISEEDILHLQKLCQYVVTVSKVADNRNRGRLKHIRVVGK